MRCIRLGVLRPVNSSYRVDFEVEQNRRGYVSHFHGSIRASNSRSRHLHLHMLATGATRRCKYAMYVEILPALITDRVQARRRDIIRRQCLSQEDMDGIELEPLTNNLANAISHAFTQPDEDFLTNGGVLPFATSTAPGSDVHSGSLEASNTLQGSDDAIVMSGALSDSPDAGTQTPTSDSEHNTLDGSGFTRYMRNWPFGLGT